MIPLVHTKHTANKDCCNIFGWASRIIQIWIRNSCGGTWSDLCFENTLFGSWSCIILSQFTPNAWAATTCLGWLWRSAHWPQVHMVQRPAPGPPPPAGGSAAGPPAPIMQEVQPMMPGMAVPFSSQSQVESDVREAKACQAMAAGNSISSGSKREEHREHKYLLYSILCLFLVDRWPIRSN